MANRAETDAPTSAAGEITQRRSYRQSGTRRRRNRRRNWLPVLLVAILVLLVALSVCLYGYNRAKKGTVPYVQDVLNSLVLDAVYAGETQTEISFSDVSEEQLAEAFRTEVEDMMQSSGAYQYAVAETSYTIESTFGFPTLTAYFDYQPDKTPLRELPVASDPLGVVETVLTALEQGDGASAVIRIEGETLTNNDVMELMDTVSANYLYPCELINYSEGLQPETGDDRILYVNVSYPLDSDRISAAKRELEAEIEDAASEISAQKVDGEQALYRAIHDYILDNVKYDEQLRTATLAGIVQEDMHLARTAYGALVNGWSVCSGYAYSFKALCDWFDLDCWVVNGQYDGESHAWNLVLLDGTVYLVDCTLDDTLYTDSRLLVSESDALWAQYVPNSNTVYPTWAA